MKDSDSDHKQPGVYSKFSAGLGSKLLAAFLVGVIIAGLGFFSGVKYQQSRQSSANTSVAQASSGNGSGTGSGQFTPGAGRRFGGLRGVMGQVTAISSSSISVQDSRHGTTATLDITGTTTVTNHGQTASAGDIHVGNTVLVRPSTTNAKQTAQIVLNPSFPGAGGSNTPSTTQGTDSPVPTQTQ